MREYCTQYEESDYRFVTRLLAESGTYFYFAAGPSGDVEAKVKDTLIPGDSVLLGNDPSAYRPVGTGKETTLPGGAATPLYYLAMQQTSASHADKVTRFAHRTKVRSDTATFRDYDPERPMARLHSSASSRPALAGPKVEVPLARPGDAPVLEVYEHHGAFLFPDWTYATAEAQRILQQERRRADVSSGESGCPHLAAGHRFALEDHPAAHLNRDYVVVSVVHRGEVLPQGHADPRVYRCTFRTVPADIAYIPARPRRQCVQVALTATVIGPPSEEIHVDERGQIKVQFHWDRESTGTSVAPAGFARCRPGAARGGARSSSRGSAWRWSWSSREAISTSP
ncbi:MAG: contractile injection system protein, VgrG/Pvc8 family [Minicystis sp.]